MWRSAWDGWPTLPSARAGMGLAILPWYEAFDAVTQGAVQALLTEFSLPVQEMHAVFPSPKLVPSKVSTFIVFLQEFLGDEWWKRAA